LPVPLKTSIDTQERERARNDLERRGLSFSETEFLQHVRSGNKENVRAYLVAGISPDARLDQVSALAASINAGQPDITCTLLEWGADPAGFREGLETKPKRKDFWEKLSSSAGAFTFASSLLVALVGWSFTSSYNERQLEFSRHQAAQEQQNKMQANRLVEMQTVEKMIPHLTKDEQSKRAALIAIGALATPELAAQIAEAYGGKGSIDALAGLASADQESSAQPAVSALTNLAKTERGSDSKPAHDALAGVLTGKEQGIVKILDGPNPFCNGLVVDGARGLIATPGYCAAGLGGNKKDMKVEFSDSTTVSPIKTSVTKDGLLAFWETGKRGLYAIPLSRTRQPVGGTVIQLGFDLGVQKLRVALSRVTGSSQMPFSTGGDFSGTVQAFGLLVARDPNVPELIGSAGAPLLDSAGDVACMTYQNDGKGSEQCLSAEVLAKALAELR
jgi:hypothetical protein